MYNKGGYRKTYNNSSYRNYKPRQKRFNYGPSRSKKLVTGDREPTMVEQIANGVGSVAKLASAVLPVISAINTELKFVDETAAINTYGTNTNASLVCLTDSAAQGLGDNNRIGQSILAKDIQLRLAMSFTATTNAASVVLGCFHRVLIVCWKDNATQNAPSITKLLQSPTNIYSPVNKDYSDQFVVLKDKYLTFNASLTPGTVTSGISTQDFKQLKFYKKLDWHMRWDGTNGPTQNHIYMLTMSTSSGATNAVATTYYSRLNFTDN